MVSFAGLPTEPFEVILILVMLGTLLFIAFSKETYQQAVAFIIYMVAVSGIYWILGAPIISVFQLTIYAGTTGVILFAAISIFSGEESEKEENKEEEEK